MKECQYCKKQMNDEETVCIICGYDQKTGTINNALKAQMAQEQDCKEKTKRKKALPDNARDVNPWVKKFAFAGLIVTLLSLFFKHNFNIGSVVTELTQPLAKLRFKLSGGKAKNNKDKQIEKVELIDLKSFEGNRKLFSKRDLKVEGIFFDPHARSFVTINGIILSEGESVDNTTVKKINKDSVELIVNGKSKTLEVNQ